EAAMHHAKKCGGNQAHHYVPDFHTQSADRLFLENGLHEAMERKELRIHYQPQVNLSTGEIMGAEALLRWHHLDRGDISPGKFIPVAEESGLILPLGDWVMATACEQLQKWEAILPSSFRIAVNLSGVQFNQPDLVSRLNQ